ncbi:hypothetical protein Spa11_33250 [Botrimarina mediterranea]|uniref:Endonuclease/exonuclease/phosphatase domain-containing protein n=1 Tax=Botrimarina mediterranea TaxID=2528022 RepID=A0A518KBE6_9BACT|nr:hypothetical protein Spa11_33250 [Botrimarina mediterranea]
MLESSTKEPLADTPRPRSLWRRAATWSVWGYTVALAVIVGSLWIGTDRWWWATILAFAPRWPWLVPAPLVLLFAVFARWGVGACALIITLGAVLMGVRVNLPLPREHTGAEFRLVTMNVAGGKVNPNHFTAIWPERIDLVVLQEGGREFIEQVVPSDWFVENPDSGGIFIASPHPIGGVDSLPRPYMPSWGQSAVRCVVETPQGPVRVVIVHLRTPRDGFERILSNRLSGIAHLKTAIEERLQESRVLREWISQWEDADRAPLVVAGDFNSPVESLVYQRYWSDLYNAFGIAGLGIGGTKNTGWHSIRIDHVLCDAETKVVSCEVTPNLGGDHRGLIVSLAMKRATGAQYEYTGNANAAR